jgi:hypothetical protein
MLLMTRVILCCCVVTAWLMWLCSPRMRGQLSGLFWSRYILERRFWFLSIARLGRRKDLNPISRQKQQARDRVVSYQITIFNDNQEILQTKFPFIPPTFLFNDFSLFK